MSNARPSLLDRTTSGVRGAVATVAVAAGIAAVANLVIYTVARGLDADLLIPDSPGSDDLSRLGVAPVIVASILPLVVAGAIAVGLGRWTQQPRRNVTVLVAVGFVLSFIPILTSDLSAGTTVALAAMHVVAASVAVLLLVPLAKPAT